MTRDTMWKEKLDSKPCMNRKCIHNLFWEGLKLNMHKIHTTNKARRIKNCFRLINETWNYEEISKTWGLTIKRVKQAEESGWKKLYRGIYKVSRQEIFMTK